jgi:hypothetical protein
MKISDIKNILLKEPVISVASIGYSGYCQPCIHSMPLDNNGRWTGQV